MENSHWYVKDHILKVKNTKNAYGINTRSFATKVIDQLNVEIKIEGVNNVEVMWDKYMRIKVSTPTCGAILLNKDRTKTLLVKGPKDKSWSFPKGKREKDEDTVQCAAREVKEEVGIDVSDTIDHYRCVRGFIKSQYKKEVLYSNATLYIINDVPEDPIEPSNRCEIAKAEWFDIKYLYSCKYSTFSRVKPFLEQLKEHLN